MSAFKYFFKSSLLLLLLLPGCSGSSSQGSSQLLKSQVYSITSTDDTLSRKWGNYLYQHLLRRSEEKGAVLWNEVGNDFKPIKVVVDAKLSHDYCIEHVGEQVNLKAKDERSAIWLIYQFVKMLSECDSRITANDLPPAIISCRNQCSDFDFVYREPYFAPNLQNEYAPIIGTNMVENDWGIWGHNLNKVLNGEESDAIYARLDGSFTSHQFCFSNDETFKQLDEYILDNFGDSEEYTQRFMIMPNDNDIVCLCKQCKAIGNTTGNATPALSALIRRLATRYPFHSFFTSAYMTTKLPSKDKWPVNTGIMISTIELPKGVDLKNQKEVKDFLRKLSIWKECTPNIYIWDYAANFDDFLTPLPILTSLKDQLHFYKSNGVKGVFLNASGYDYSPFDDVKTYVSAALMKDIDLPVDSLCNLYFSQFYPASGGALSAYYLSLEKRMLQNKKPYNMYGGFKEALNIHIDATEFVKFYDSLPSFIAVAKNDEKLELEKLYTALSFVRLQIAYTLKSPPYGFATIKGKKMFVDPTLEAVVRQLSGYKKFRDLSNYKEVDGSIDVYLSNWYRLYEESPYENLLINEPIVVLSVLDEDYKNIKVLNDGVQGFVQDYHQGWHLTSVDNLHIQFDAQNLKKARNLSIRFLISEKHHIFPPEKIELYKDNMLYKEILPVIPEIQDGVGIAVATAPVNLSDAKRVSLKLYRRQGGRSSLACDEIRLY